MIDYLDMCRYTSHTGTHEYVALYRPTAVADPQNNTNLLYRFGVQVRKGRVRLRIRVSFDMTLTDIIGIPSCKLISHETSLHFSIFSASLLPFPLYILGLFATCPFFSTFGVLSVFFLP